VSRTLTVPVAAALADGNVPALVFVDLDFASGHLRLTNAAHAIEWDGETWYGAGGLGSIEPVQETSDLQAVGVAMRITGIDSANITRALGEHYQGRPCRIWFAPLDADHQVLADPILIWTGRMDTMQIELGETASITLTAESRLVDWERPRVRRYNDADQRAEYPADRGFEFVEQMAEKELVWGRG